LKKEKMNTLIIERTSNTPYIEFNPETGILEIEGRSIPENPGEFFNNLLEWIDEYFKSPKETTKINVQLEYINSGSSKLLLEFFRRIKNYHESGNECIVNWYYEEDDESVMELGEHYKNTLKMPFNLIDYY